MTKGDGTVIGEASYDEYGVKLGSTITTRFAYNGKFGVEDDGTGLYQMRSRYYNVDLKKFMNRDVVVGTSTDSQSLNRYAYVNGNPINYTDPFGMAREVVESSGKFDHHLLLDAVGLVPLFGEIADVANAVLYLSEGDYLNASISGLAVVPIYGSIGTGTRVGIKISGKVETGKDFLKRSLNGVLDYKFRLGSSVQTAGSYSIPNEVSARDVYSYFSNSFNSSDAANFGELKLNRHREKIADHGVAPRHRNEIVVNRYNVLSSKHAEKGDDVEGHHLVSKEFLAKYNILSKDGIALNMNKDRHSGTPTYKAQRPKMAAYLELDPRDTLAYDLRQVRIIYRDAGFDRKEINDVVREVIRQWEAHESGLMVKK